jgi:hypothetical protein
MKDEIVNEIAGQRWPLVAARGRLTDDERRTLSVKACAFDARRLLTS